MPSLKEYVQNLLKKPAALMQLREFKKLIRPSDVFFVSYPKSGVTWLSYLITNVLIFPDTLDLLWDEDRVVDVNRLYKGKGVGWDIQKINQLPSPRFFKIHADKYDPSFPNVVYMIRDPRSVVVSLWHYLRSKKSDFKISLEEFVADHQRWGMVWEKQVKEWLIDHQHPHLILIRYEDLHKDTAATLKQVLDFSDIACTEDVIEHSVKAADFIRMKNLEEKVIKNLDQEAHDRYFKRDEIFFRKGEREGWKKELGPDCIQLIERRYGKIMNRLGYGS